MKLGKGKFKGMDEDNGTHIKGDWKWSSESGRLQAGGRRAIEDSEGGHG